jgi:hypothetical protein
MRILWLTIDRSNRLATHFDDFRREVSRYATVEKLVKFTDRKLARKWAKGIKDGEIKTPEVLSKTVINKDYDFVFTDALFAYTEEDWHLVKQPKGFLIEDCHGDIPRWQMNVAHKAKFDIVFYRGRTVFNRFFPSASSNFLCKWLPFSADPCVFSPSKAEVKPIDVLHVGCVGKAYPVRNKVIEALDGMITIIPRPNEKAVSKWPRGKDYADLVSSAKICVTCGSIYNGPVKKYFEIPLCRTAVMTNWFRDLQDLGFKPNKHVIVYDFGNVAKQVKKLLSERSHIEDVANEGMEFVRINHSLQYRALQFLDHVRSCL